jgi:hypothetical protein
MRARGARAFRIAAIAVAAAWLAACQTAGDPLVTGSITGAITPAGNTVAIESIDGPPRPVFDRLVAQLAAQAEAKQLPIVSREGASAYRVRLYLLAEIEGRKARISWVADLYDGAQQRLIRLTGEEPAGAARKDLWQKLDNATLARIAARCLEAIMAATGPGPRQPAPDTPRDGGPRPVIAFADPAH